MRNDTEMLTTVQNELKMSLAEDTPAEDIERAAKAIEVALRGIWLRPAYQARVKKGVKLNMREEASSKAKIDGQLFENAVVSVINPDPEGPDEFVQIVYAAYASRKSMDKINNG